MLVVKTDPRYENTKQYNTSWQVEDALGTAVFTSAMKHACEAFVKGAEYGKRNA